MLMQIDLHPTANCESIFNVYSNVLQIEGIMCSDYNINVIVFVPIGAKRHYTLQIGGYI